MTFYLRSAVVFAVLFSVTLATASAHPLGNFTINHLTKLSFSTHRVDARFVLDMAEIPTYQTMREASPDGTFDAAHRAAWARRETNALVPQLVLAVDNVPVALTVDGALARTRPGAGGLPTLYLTIDAHATLPPSTAVRSIAFRDATFPGRLGWHDVVVAPAAEPTHELRAYPNALIGSPRSTVTIAGTLAPNGVVAVTASGGGDTGSSVPAQSAVRSNQLSDMLARGTSDWGFVLLTFGVAIALGALHALEPGHGKTLLAVSLVGARATVKQAAILASALTVAHTVGVLALGVAINVFKGYFVPEAIYPWITLASGIVIAVIGARAVQRQMRVRAQARGAVANDRGHTHDHPHDHDHAYDHAHDHSHGHTHDHASLDDAAHARAHAIPGNAPLTFGGTVWAAMSGGVAPCPAALVVLLAAVALNQVAYGIFVIVAFSFGLAATLTGLGIAVVRSASWLGDRPAFGRFVRYGPLVSAIVISTIGAIMVGQGFAQQGIAISPIVVTAATAAAIVAYAVALPLALRRPVGA